MTTLTGALGFYFPLSTHHNAMVRCDRCGQFGHHTVWTDGEHTLTLGYDCAKAVGFSAGWHKALTERAIDDASKLAREDGFVGSFGASVRDRLINGQRLSERQACVLSKLMNERGMPRLAAELTERFASVLEAA